MRDWPKRKFCQLASLLVDDRSIDRGIIAPNGIAPVLFFFVRCGDKDLTALHEWLTDGNGKLKECNFIKLVAWLEGELFFCATTKMELICYLYESGEFEQMKTKKSISNAFYCPLPPDIEEIIKKLI